MNYAGFWRRVGASFIDGIILMLPGLILSGIVRSVPLSLGTGFILGFLYRPIFESSALAGTPGKALLGMVVVNENGEPITFKQACIRFFCSYLSILTAYIGYLMQPFTARRQTLHDMIAETVVIRRESSPDINYFKVWKTQFKSVIEKL